MKWADLTDILCCRKFDHSFIIHKEFGLATWQVINQDKIIIAEGTTGKIARAKASCKEVYNRLKVEYKIKQKEQAKQAAITKYDTL